MDEIIIKVLSGDAEPLDELRLNNWRSESAENDRHFLDVSAIWHTAEGSPVEPEESTPPPPSVEAVVRRGEALSRTDARRHFARAVRRREVWPWAAAAALATVSLGIWIGRSGSVGVVTGGTEFIASNTQAETVALPDGSFIRIAPSSVVRFDSDDSQREAWLRGRAFFAVASSPERPFLVHTDLGETRVLGTRFEVDSGEGELKVTVVEGHVTVTAPDGRSADVFRDQVARLGADGVFAVVPVEDAYALLDWPGGLLVFQATPLLQVAEEVGAHFDVPIELSDPALTQRTVTAWFEDEDLHEVVDSICLLVQAECDSVGGGFKIGG